MASFDEVVLPGKAGKIKASVNTSHYTGDITKAITVTDNDSSQPTISLTVKAKVVGSVTVLPYPAIALAPRLQRNGAPSKLLIRKDPTEQGTMKIGGLKASADWLKAAVRPVTAVEPPAEGLPEAQPGDVVLSVELGDTPPQGYHAETVVFNTGLPREPTVSIPVNVTVRGPIMLQPSDLILQTLPTDPHRATGRVFVNVREDLDPSQLTVVSGDKAFVAKMDASTQRAFQMTVDWTDSGTGSPTETVLQLRLGDVIATLPVRVNAPRVLQLSPDHLTPH
ncbi:MAG TPA: hypothetical protein VMR65_10985 [Candidatus Sulfotelmatobacter sp.]|nr:hypothetical protein [Candidatus Sulfotelmatobacter sp.]